MADEFRIEAGWEILANGSPEERACFAEIGIAMGDLWLTQAEDKFVKRVRDRVHLSGYRLAEWLAWNWWRLRWEPKAARHEWGLAHRTASIGGGYVWPNLTIYSDGERIVVQAKPTASRPSEPLRYLADMTVVLPADLFVAALDGFVDQVRGQLRAERIEPTNLDRIWTDVLRERENPESAEWRKFEALLGHDPGEGDPEIIETLRHDARSFGQSAMFEVAADDLPRSDVLTGQTIQEAADLLGSDSSPASGIRLRASGAELRLYAEQPWQHGKNAASAVRAEQELGSGELSNRRLADMAGMRTAVLKSKTINAPLPFALDSSPTHGRVVLRSAWETGRRFELARLIADRIAFGDEGTLFPATHARTYRQRMQRAFAAELLSPYAAVQEMLAGQYSEDAMLAVAKYYNVSDHTIRTQLLSHGAIRHDDPMAEIGQDAA